MKKALIFALSLSMLAAFAIGCTADEPAPAATEAPAATAEVIEETTDAPMEEIPAEEATDETVEESPADATTGN